MISGNFRGEILAVAGRAVRIGESDDVACAGINLPVAAKRILPLVLRAAVQRRQRIVRRTKRGVGVVTSLCVVFALLVFGATPAFASMSAFSIGTQGTNPVVQGSSTTFTVSITNNNSNRDVNFTETAGAAGLTVPSCITIQSDGNPHNYTITVQTSGSTPAC